MNELNVVAALLTIAVQSKNPSSYAPKATPVQRVLQDYQEILQHLEVHERAKKQSQ